MMVKQDDMPARVVYHGSDQVNYYTLDKKGSKIYHESKPCYRDHITTHDKYSFMCVPWAAMLENKKSVSRLPGECFLRFMQICQQYGLLSADANYSHVNGQNILTFNGALVSRPLAFTMFCLYRWCDTSPSMIYRIVRNVDQNPKAIFWLAFQRELKTVGTGHSFVNISSGIYGGGLCKTNDLRVGLALKHLYTPGKKMHDPKFVSAGLCAVEIDKMIKKINEQALIAEPEDDALFLDDKWQPLFNLKDTNSEEIMKVYLEIKGSNFKMPTPPKKPKWEY